MYAYVCSVCISDHTEVIWIQHSFFQELTGKEWKRLNLEVLCIQIHMRCHTDAVKYEET